MSGDQNARARVSSVSSPAARRRRRRRGYVLTPNEGVYAKIPVCRPDEWLAAVEHVLTMPSVEALRRRLRVAGASTVLAAAREWAQSADRLTGRDVAVAHATVAAAIGYAAATVKRIMRFLSRLGLIVECARGRNLISLDELAEARLTRAKLVRDARGDGVEDGLRRVAGWGLRYDLVPVDADRDVSQRSQGADDLADARPGEVLEMA